MTIMRRTALVAAAGLFSAAVVGSAGAQQPGRPVKIGVLNDMVGPYADITGK